MAKRRGPMIHYTSFMSLLLFHSATKRHFRFTSNTMAESVNVTDGLLSEAVLNESAHKNVTDKVPSTPEGMAIAYGSLVIMALVPIFFGAFRSVRYHREQKVPVIMLCTGCSVLFRSNIC
jgi:hypothetical protein